MHDECASGRDDGAENGEKNKLHQVLCTKSLHRALHRYPASLQYIVAQKHHYIHNSNELEPSMQPALTQFRFHSQHRLPPNPIPGCASSTSDPIEGSSRKPHRLISGPQQSLSLCLRTPTPLLPENDRRLRCIVAIAGIKLAPLRRHAFQHMRYIFAAGNKHVVSEHQWSRIGSRSSIRRCGCQSRSERCSDRRNDPLRFDQ